MTQENKNIYKEKFYPDLKDPILEIPENKFLQKERNLMKTLFPPWEEQKKTQDLRKVESM